MARGERWGPVCPECTVGKHGACDTGAWDFTDDHPTYCRCWADHHGRPEPDPGERELTDDQIAARENAYEQRDLGMRGP